MNWMADFQKPSENWIQWGSEIRTSLDLKWSKRGWVANFEWDLKFRSPIIWNPDKWPPFCQKPFWMVFFSKVGTPSGVHLFDHLLWFIFIFIEKFLPLPGFEPGTYPVPRRYATNWAILARINFKWSSCGMFGNIAIVKAWLIEVRPSKSPDFRSSM